MGVTAVDGRDASYGLFVVICCALTQSTNAIAHLPVCYAGKHGSQLLDPLCPRNSNCIEDRSTSVQGLLNSDVGNSSVLMESPTTDAYQNRTESSDTLRQSLGQKTARR